MRSDVANWYANKFGPKGQTCESRFFWVTRFRAKFRVDQTFGSRRTGPAIFNQYQIACPTAGIESAFEAKVMRRAIVRVARRDAGFDSR